MKKKENYRTCIVTRNALNRDALIRFVVDPNGEIVPDLKEKLPGRGVWTTNRQEIVQKAQERNMFKAAFKDNVHAGENLLSDIAKLMMSDVAMGLSIARKSGLVITGFSKVESAARRGTLKLIFHGRDGTQDGANKIISALKAGQVSGGYKKGIPEPFAMLSSAELDKALGLTNTVHVGVLAGGAATRLKEKVARIRTYCA